MNIFERLILVVNPKAALNRAYYKQLCRSYYDAAGRTRDNWARGNTTGETELGGVKEADFEIQGAGAGTQ